MADKAQEYYSYLKNAGANVPPTYDQFSKVLSDDSKSQQYFNYLKQNKFNTPNDFNTFKSVLMNGSQSQNIQEQTQPTQSDVVSQLQASATPISQQSIAQPQQNDGFQLLQQTIPSETNIAQQHDIVQKQQEHLADIHQNNVAEFQLAKNDLNKSLGANNDILLNASNTYSKIKNGEITDPEVIKNYNEVILPQAQVVQQNLDNAYKHHAVSVYGEKDEQGNKDAKLVGLAEQYADARKKNDIRSYEVLDKIHKIDPNWQFDESQLNPEIEQKHKDLFQNALANLKLNEQRYNQALAAAKHSLVVQGISTTGNPSEIDVAQTAALPLIGGANDILKHYNQAREQKEAAKQAFDAAYKAYVLKENLGKESKDQWHPIVSPILNAIGGVGRTFGHEFLPLEVSGSILPKDQQLAATIGQQKEESGLPMSSEEKFAQPSLSQQVGAGVGNLGAFVVKTLPIAAITGGISDAAGVTELANGLLAEGSTIGQKAIGAAINANTEGVNFAATSGDLKDYGTGAAFGLAGNIGGKLTKMIAKNPYIAKLAETMPTTAAATSRVLGSAVGSTATLGSVEALHYADAAVNHLMGQHDWKEALRESGIDPDMYKEGQKQLSQDIVFSLFGLTHAPEKPKAAEELKVMTGEKAPEQPQEVSQTEEDAIINSHTEPTKVAENVKQTLQPEPTPQPTPQTNEGVGAPLNEPINKVEPNISTAPKLDEVVGKQLKYRGQEGIIVKDEGGKFEFHTPNMIIELGNENVPISDWGMKVNEKEEVPHQIEVHDENTATINGNKYTINTDEKGNVVSVSPENKPEQQIKNEKLITQVEIARNKLEHNPKELSTIAETPKAEYDAATSHIAEQKILEGVYNKNMTETISSALDKLDSGSKLDEQEKLQTEQWVFDALDNVQRLIDENPSNSHYEQAHKTLETINELLNENRNNDTETTVPKPTEKPKRRSGTKTKNTTTAKNGEGEGNQTTNNPEGGSTAPESVGGKTEGGQGNAAETEIGRIASKLINKEPLSKEEQSFVDSNIRDVHKEVGKQMIEKLDKQQAEVKKESNPQKNKKENPIQKLLTKYNEDVKYGIFDLVNDVEDFAKNSGNQKLLDAVGKYRQEEDYNFSISGRHDMEQVENDFVKKIEQEINNLNQNTNEKANEVREIEKGQRKPEDERGQPIGGKERQEADVQEEKVGQGEATPQSLEQKRLKAQHNTLVDLVKEYNNTPANKKTKLGELISQIRSRTRDMGYSIKQAERANEKLVVLGKHGKPIIKVAEKTDLPTPSVEQLDYLKSVTKNFGVGRGSDSWRIDAGDLGMTTAEIDKALKDLSENKVTTPVKKLADAIGNYGDRHTVRVIRGEGGSSKRSEMQLNPTEADKKVVDALNNLGLTSKFQTEEGIFDKIQVQDLIDLLKDKDKLAELGLEKEDIENFKKLINEHNTSIIAREDNPYENHTELHSDSEAHDKTATAEEEYDSVPWDDEPIEPTKQSDKPTLEKQVKDAESEVGKAQRAYDNAKTQLEKNGQQDQKDIFGKAPSESLLIKNDLADQQKIVSDLKDKLDAAKENLLKSQSELDNFNPNQLKIQDNATNTNAASDWLRKQADDIKNEKNKGYSSFIPPHLIEKGFRLLADAIDAGVNIKNAIADIVAKLTKEHEGVNGIELEKELLDRYNEGRNKDLSPKQLVVNGHNVDEVLKENPKYVQDLKDKLTAHYEKTNPELFTDKESLNAKLEEGVTKLKNNLVAERNRVLNGGRNYLAEGKPEDAYKLFKANGMNDFEAEEALGKIKDDALTEQQKVEATKSVMKNLLNRVTAFVGERGASKRQALMVVDEIQKDIKSSLEKGQKLQDVDMAMHVYLDMQRNPEHLAEYLPKIEKGAKEGLAKFKEAKRIIDLSQNLTDKQKEVAQKIADTYKGIGEQAKNEGIINEVLDNYVGRTWDINGKAASENNFRFATSTRHSIERSLDTIIQGLANGMDLKYKGASTNLGVIMEELGNVIANRNFIEEGLKQKIDTGMKDANGKPIKASLFTTNSDQQGYKQIDNKNFRSYQGGNKIPIYAPEPIANSLNNILGSSTFKEGSIMKKIETYNAALKVLELSLSPFHAFQFGRRHFFGATHDGFANMNPIKAYKQGLEMIQKDPQFVLDLVKHGNVNLGITPEWSEMVIDHSTYLGKQMDKLAFTKAAKDGVLNLNKDMHNWLFNKFGTGLTLFDAKTEYERLSKVHPEMSNEEKMKVVGKFISNLYGNKNWDIEHGSFMQNKKNQSLLRQLFLAPNWTISNLALAKNAFSKGVEGELYRRMWAKTILKGLALSLTANAGLALMNEDDEDAKKSFSEKFAGRYKRAYKNGLIHTMDVDITPLYHAFGGNPKKVAYLSTLGAFDEPLKAGEAVTKGVLGVGNDKNENWKGNAMVNYVSSKLSPIARMTSEAVLDKDWQDKQFKSIDQVVDDYKQGGKNKFSLTKRAGKDEKHLIVSPSQLPTYALHQVMGLVPISLTTGIQMMEGQKDGVEALMNLSGIGVKTMKDKEDFSNLTPEEKHQQRQIELQQRMEEIARKRSGK